MAASQELIDRLKDFFQEALDNYETTDPDLHSVLVQISDLALEKFLTTLTSEETMNNPLYEQEIDRTAQVYAKFCLVDLASKWALI